MIPPQVWVMLIQAAVPLGIDLTQAVISLIEKQASGKAITNEDWDALAIKWGQKTSAQYLTDALAKV